MRRNEIEQAIRHVLKGLETVGEGEFEIQIKEGTTDLRVFNDAFNEESDEVHEVLFTYSMPKERKEKISQSLSGKNLGNETKKRIRHNSNRANVFQYDMEGELVRVWPSVRAIEREKGYNNSLLSKCCRGLLSQAYGYKWAYSSISDELELDEKPIIIRIVRHIDNNVSSNGEKSSEFNNSQTQ